MITRPKISQNEWKTTEIWASEVGIFAPFCCPVVGEVPLRGLDLVVGRVRLEALEVLGDVGEGGAPRLAHDGRRRLVADHGRLHSRELVRERLQRRREDVVVALGHRVGQGAKFLQFRLDFGALVDGGGLERLRL